MKYTPGQVYRVVGVLRAADERIKFPGEVVVLPAAMARRLMAAGEVTPWPRPPAPPRFILGIPPYRADAPHDSGEPTSDEPARPLDPPPRRGGGQAPPAASAA